MTSYGDVRKIIEDVFKIASTLKTVYKAEEKLKELTKETEILSKLVDDVRKSGRNFESNKDFQNTLQETNGLIADLKQQLEKRKTSINKLLDKFKWPIRQNDFEQDLDKARRLTNLLSQMNMTLSIRHFSDTKQNQLVDDFIKQWTPPMAVELLGAYPRVQVTDGTGLWILDNDQYQNWEQSRNGLLWINGLQGCGKTGLAITVDDRFRARQQQHQKQTSPAIQVATVFCYHQIDGMRKLEDHMEILMSLWVQLIKSKAECLQDIEWIKMSREYHHPAVLTGQRRVKVQKELLQHALKHSGNTVLILDGLDEIPRTLQRKVIQDLRNLQRENDNCRILITSRPYDSIMRIFKNDPQVYMEAPDVDLTLYMEERFSQQDWDRHSDFKSCDIINILLPECQKSFILTQLIMDEVERADSKAHCERIISELPATVDEAYRRGLNRLKAESSSDGLVDGLPCMSIQALFWVAFAPRPTTGDQLEHALAIADSNPISVPKVRKWRERGIDSQTGKLVVIDPENGILIPAHKTFTTYLTKDETRLEFFPKIREHIHEVQLKCLLADHCKSEVLAGTKKEYFEQYPLLPYALSNWGMELDSIIEQETTLWHRTKDFLSTSFHEWNELIKDLIFYVFKGMSRSKTDDFLYPGSIDGLYWVVLFDLQRLVPFCIDVNTECLVKDPAPTTPLGLAAILHNMPMMRLLIMHGAQVNLTQRTNILVHSPLYDAVFGNARPTIRLLIKSGADMTSRRGAYYQSALDLVYSRAYTGTVRAIASNIPNLNRKSAQELQFLVKSGRVKDLQRAIQRGMDINHPCENGKRALDYALEMGNEEIVELLRNNKAVSNLCWPAEKTESCPYPMNLHEPTVTPLVSIEKEYDQDVVWKFKDGFEPKLMLEIPIHTDRPIWSIVFETITADAGWIGPGTFPGTYIGSGHSRLDVVLSNQDGRPQRLVLQENLHASDIFRLHTNIWNLSELEVSSPAKAKLMRDIRDSSILQIFACPCGGFWYNRVKYIRVRMYGEEIHPQA
ncbi:unnamed protein product [Fusarium graminearum]|nr:unnamed protein product [Fusarium graminearum]